jgi:hypothetical protein
MYSSFSRTVQIAFWVMLFSFNLYLSIILLGWTDGISRSVINVLCHLINFYAFYSFIVPRFYENRKLALTILACILIIGLLTPVRLMIETEFALQENFSLRFGFAGKLGFVLFTEIAVASFASLLRLAQDNEKNKQRLESLSRLQAESELRFLKAQMNPHFLFNTINNIYSLTLLKSDKAPEALMKLSTLLRYLLYESNDKVPLQKEVEALRIYAELFQLRYEESLDIKINCAVNDKVEIEPLVLVPILENALKHSGLGVIEKSFACMELEKNGDQFTVNCVNSKSASNRNEDAGGIGLVNIQKRLNMAYGGKHRLILRDEKDKFHVRLQIDFQT